MRVRATLRVWLGEFLRLPPALVPLHQAPSGLLGLLLPFQDWSVSVSASRDMGLLSVSPPGQGAVGVDIEWGDTTLDLASLAPPALSVAERSLLDTLPEVSRRAAFFRLWTRKEAVAKALALGVSAFDAGLDLASLPHTEMAAWQDISVFGRSLHLRDLPAPPGYHAALAVTR
jgi:4'-phosphopantetheinyl transferase